MKTTVSMPASRVWLVLLNWNNARDTIECLDSIREVRDPAIAGVVVCDNASSDDSMERLQAWARSVQQPLLCLGNPWSPEAADRWMQDQLRSGGSEERSDVPMVLLQTGANLGFAGGNNVGVRFIMQHARYEHVLLLNNDTLLTPDSVGAIARRLDQDPTLGLCGATVVYNRDRRLIQACGGARFEPWLGRASHIGAHTDVAAVRSQHAVEQQLDYVLGAAMMVTRRCLETVGLLHEGYFLYYEEIDWAVRIRRAGLRLGYAADALIYHKEGGTIGSSAVQAKRSLLSEYFLCRSRMRFTARFFPWFLPTVFGFGMARALRTLLQGDLPRARTQWRGILGLKRQA